MTQIEMVWTKLKVCAAEYAFRGERPGPLRAHAVVVELLQEAYVNPWPEPYVIEFYANELLAMVEERLYGSTSGSATDVYPASGGSAPGSTA